MAKRSSITIGDTCIQPGERATIDLPIAKLYTHTEMNLPIHVVHGKKDGPVLFVSAAIHGDEMRLAGAAGSHRNGGPSTGQSA